MYVGRIVEKEKQWAVKLKETLAKKEQRIRTIQHDRDKMIAEVSSTTLLSVCVEFRHQNHGSKTAASV